MALERHFFSFYTDGSPLFQEAAKVRSTLSSMGGQNIYFYTDSNTGECKFSFSARPYDSNQIFLYIATLNKCRVYM